MRGNARHGAGRKATLEDVAREAGVSRSLVSIVVRGAPGASDETRARVLAVVEELGYRPDARARMLATSSSRLIGVTYLVESLHHADLLSPIYETAEAAGYDVILSGRTPQHDEQRAVNVLLGYRCDAVLLLGSELPEAAMRRLGALVSTVEVGRRLALRTTTVDVVRTDEELGLRLAVEHLASLGHRRIAHVDGGPALATMTSDRRQFFLNAMDRLGLGASAQVVPGGNTIEAGRTACHDLTDPSRRPTAVITFNDESAWGLMRTLSDVGLRVPGDISVVGYDGSPLARIAPQELTTVAQDAPALGRTAVERAIAILERAEPVGDIVLPPSLLVGETTAAPRRAAA